jgi:hypothetical protein
MVCAVLGFGPFYFEAAFVEFNRGANKKSTITGSGM